MNSFVLMHPFLALLVFCDDGDSKTIPLPAACMAQYQSNLDKIKSLEYRGKIRGWVHNTPEGVTRLHSRHFKAANKCRYLELQHLELDTPGGVDKDHYTVCYKPGGVEVYHHLNRTLEFSRAFATVESNKKLEYSAFDFYIVAIGWTPEKSERTKRTFQANRWPIASVESATWPTTAGRHTVRGEDCYLVKLVEKHLVTEFWLAEDLGFMPVQIKQEFEPRGQSEAYQVLFEFESFEDVDGIALPKVVKRSIFAGGKSRPAAYSELAIESLKINHLDQADFQIPVGEGCLSLDFETKHHTASPGGLDLMSGTIGYGRELLRRRGPRTAATQTIYFSIGMFAMLLGSFMLFKCRSTNT